MSSNPKKTHPQEHSGRGRPRDMATRRKILRQCLFLAEEAGYGALTIEGLAAKAGVAKTTIYRWWTSKGHILLEAMLDLADTTIEAPPSGSLEQELTVFMRRTFEELTDNRARILRALMVEALVDPGFAQQLRESLVLPRRAYLRSIFERARARGEIWPGIDFEVALDNLYGAMWYRLLVGHGPLTPDYAEKLVKQVVEGLVVRIWGQGT